MRKVIGSIVLCLGLAPAMADRPVPELSGKLDCGTLKGSGKIHIILLGQYIGTMTLICQEV